MAAVRPPRTLPTKRLNGRSSGHVDQFVAGHLALRDQIHHGQKRLPVLDQEAGQLLFILNPAVDALKLGLGAGG